MQFKLDENADQRWAEPLTSAGFEVSTVALEGLSGTEGRILADTCRELGFCLITVDLDFAQVLHYPPGKYAGLVILRHPKPTLRGMRDLVRQIAVAVRQESPVGRLWIVEPGRIRIKDSSDQR